MQRFMRPQATDIQSFKQKGQFSGSQLQDLLFGLGPFKALLFQSFLPQAKTVALPVQNLDQVPPPVAENEQVTRQRLCIATHNRC